MVRLLQVELVLFAPHFLEVGKMKTESVLERIGTIVFYPKLSTRLLDDGRDPQIVRLKNPYIKGNYFWSHDLQPIRCITTSTLKYAINSRKCIVAVLVC